MNAVAYVCPQCGSSVMQHGEDYLCNHCCYRFHARPWGVSFLSARFDSMEAQQEFEQCNREAREYEAGQRRKSEPFLKFQGWLFATRVGPVSNKIVMDAGCGTGLISEALAALKYKIVAVDFSDASLEVLWEKKLADTTIVQADLTKLPFPDNCCGGIVSASVLQHIPPLERKNAFQQIARCLAPGGKLVFCVYTRDYFIKRNQPTEGSYSSGVPYWSFTHHEIREAAQEAGLVSVVVRPFGIALHLRNRRGGWRFYYTFAALLNGLEARLHRFIPANRYYPSEYWIVEAYKPL